MISLMIDSHVTGEPASAEHSMLGFVRHTDDIAKLVHASRLL